MAKPRRAPETAEVSERPMPHSEAELEKESRMPAGRDIHRKHRRTRAETTPEDVTGINPEKMHPIDPRMVYIPPA
ncbi:MAG TPA: hypothetical protein VJ810_22590 [Blastocatellia bacterium]|nr:hypothetical protein [Blastocatellia bacterium]